MGQGTSDYGVDLNHRPPYGDRHLKYPQSSPLTNMYEQGTWPWRLPGGTSGHGIGHLSNEVTATFATQAG
jgi:hypothetical protein